MYLLMYAITIYHCYKHKLPDQDWKDISEGSALLHLNSFAVQMETRVHSAKIHMSYHFISGFKGLEITHDTCSVTAF